MSSFCSANETLHNIALRRNDTSHPWGFRLEGGADHHRMLSIRKVNAHSIAEKAGLRDGDVVIKMGNISASDLTHEQAKMEIIRAGNDIDFVVQRGLHANRVWKASVTPVANVPYTTQHPPQQYKSMAYQKPPSKPAQQQYELPTHLSPSNKMEHRIFNNNNNGNGSNNNNNNNNTDVVLATHTSLATNKSSPVRYATFNAVPTPFFDTQYVTNDESGRTKRISHNSYNSPMGLYSHDNIEQSFQQTLQEAVHPAQRHFGHHVASNINPNNNNTNINNIDNSTNANSVTVQPKPVLSPSATSSYNNTASNTAPHSATDIIHCGFCGELVKGVFVRVQGKTPAHPACLKCSKCGVGLRNIGYFFIEGKLYCEVHAKQITRPMESGMKAVVTYR